MIKERTVTGGQKEFVYTSEDRERIENQDTESTKDFKNAYKEWLETKPPKKHPKQLHVNRKQVIIFCVIVFIILLLFFLFQWKQMWGEFL